MSRPKGKISGLPITVPDELRDILLEFTVNYLLEQPGDVVEYGFNYFKKLMDDRNATQTEEETTTLDSPDESMLSDTEEPPFPRSSRRKAVSAEAYNPNEDEDEAEEGERVIYPKTDQQRERLTESVKNIFLFKALDKEQMQVVLDAMFEKTVKAGDYVIKQGDDGDNFYVIESGIFKAYVKSSEPGAKPQLVHTYNNSGSFGELALLYNVPRAATIQADTEGSLWGMDRQAFRRILLKSAFKKRKMYETLLESVPMLKALKPYERMNLADALVPCTYTDGQQIIKQGDSADGMYFVEQGSVKITKIGENGEEVEINRISKEGYFGELALITHNPRAASAYAIGDVKLAFLEVEAFERLLGPCMDIMKRKIKDYENK